MISTERQTRQQRTIALLLLAMMMAATLALAMRNPRSYGLGVLCPSRRIFGVYCAGCGATRASYDLLHGDFVLAWRNNPLYVLVGVPMLIWLGASLASSVLWGRRLMLMRARCALLPFDVRPRATPWIGYAIVFILLLYTALRNIPGAALDGFRPPAYTAVSALEK